MPQPSGHRTIQPPASPGAEIRLAHLLRDGRRLVYVRADDAGSGVFVADPETGWRRRLTGSAAPIVDLAISADGGYVAWASADPLAPAVEHTIHWAYTDAPGEQGRIPGTALAWSPSKPALFIADPKQKALVRLDLTTGQTRALAEMADDGIPGFPPRITVAAEARRIAFTQRRAADGVTEVWILGRNDDGSAWLLTQVPGIRIHVDPFWSPGGGSIGMHLSHPGQEKSAVVLVPKLEGEGEISHRSDHAGAPGAPAWSPSSAYIAFFAAQRGAAPRLSLLDCRTRDVVPLLDPGEGSGVARFLDAHHLAVEGGPAEHVLSFDDPL
jgi:Tol biopolymer transport system component